MTLKRIYWKKGRIETYGEKGPRTVKGWLLMEELDHMDETTLTKAMAPGMDWFVGKTSKDGTGGHGGPMIDTHTNEVIGHWFDWGIGLDPDTGLKGMWLEGVVHKGPEEFGGEFPQADKAWNDGKAGKWKGLSWGGNKRTGYLEYDTKTGEVMGNTITKVLPFEVSIISEGKKGPDGMPAIPAVPHSKIIEMASVKGMPGTYADKDVEISSAVPGEWIANCQERMKFLGEDAKELCTVLYLNSGSRVKETLGSPITKKELELDAEILAEKERGVPKTEEERRRTHRDKYGDEDLPPRGTGLEDEKGWNRASRMIDVPEGALTRRGPRGGIQYWTEPGGGTGGITDEGSPGREALKDPKYRKGENKHWYDQGKGLAEEYLEGNRSNKDVRDHYNWILKKAVSSKDEDKARYIGYLTVMEKEMKKRKLIERSSKKELESISSEINILRSLGAISHDNIKAVKESPLAQRFVALRALETSEKKALSDLQRVLDGEGDKCNDTKPRKKSEEDTEMALDEETKKFLEGSFNAISAEVKALETSVKALEVKKAKKEPPEDDEPPEKGEKSSTIKELQATVKALTEKQAATEKALAELKVKKQEEPPEDEDNADKDKSKKSGKKEEDDETEPPSNEEEEKNKKALKKAQKDLDIAEKAKKDAEALAAAKEAEALEAQKSVAALSRKVSTPGPQRSRTLIPGGGQAPPGGQGTSINPQKFMAMTPAKRQAAMDAVPITPEKV